VLSFLDTIVGLHVSSALILGLQKSAADGTTMGDYDTVKSLIKLISHIPPDARYFNDIVIKISII
jgi:hypothetical protein